MHKLNFSNCTVDLTVLRGSNVHHVSTRKNNIFNGNQGRNGGANERGPIKHHFLSLPSWVERTNRSHTHEHTWIVHFSSNKYYYTTSGSLRRSLLEPRQHIFEKVKELVINKISTINKISMPFLRASSNTKSMTRTFKNYRSRSRTLHCLFPNETKFWHLQFHHRITVLLEDLFPVTGKR